MATPDTSWFDQLEAAPAVMQGGGKAPVAQPPAIAPAQAAPTSDNSWFDNLESVPAPQFQQQAQTQVPGQDDAQRQAWLNTGINPLPPSSNPTVEAVRQWLAPDPNKAYARFAPLSRDSAGLHWAIPSVVRQMAYGLTENPSDTVTINPDTGYLGMTPEAASVTALAAPPLRFSGARSVAAIPVNAGDATAPLSKEFTSAPLTPEMGEKALPAPAGETSATGIPAPKQVPSFEPPKPETASDAKSLASSYYQAADTAGGTLTPEFTNKFVDAVGKIAPQTEEGLTVAGPTPITSLVQRIQALRDKPISLHGAQEIDEALGGLISNEYGVKGISKDGKNLLDLQSTFRDMIANAGPEDVQGGTAGFDALAQGRQAWAQAMKMSDLERIQERAALTNNPATSIKSGIRVLLSNPTRVRGYSPNELDALKYAADRGALGSIFHVFGSRLLPMGAALMGEHGAGPLGAAVAGGVTHGGTSLMRSAAEALQESRLKQAMDAISQNAPAPPGWKPTPPLAPTMTGKDFSGSVPWRLAPPAALPGPSQNPVTGLPEFNLPANQAASGNDMAMQIAQQMSNGALADHKALADWVNQNKRQLRMQFGGQGLQNIMQVGALMRRASAEQTPSTVLSALLKGAAPDVMQQAGGNVAALLAQAIAAPRLTQVLAAKSKGPVTKTGQSRVMALLSAPDGNGPSGDSGAGTNERHAANALGGNSVLPAAKNGADLEGRVGARNAPGAGSKAPPKVPQNQLAQGAFRATQAAP